ncbi:hypothetical protein IFM89_001144 [Coptis chinensis]|uniref:Pentatricopeptide repeat-containing protein-mitochondrial domain-containing protein n=1 Tax=Coptis chinensis TaxID=261450 RepID=A0A835IIH3_9MAGN|nr:hypothetical protein IFM89_001144 [Coptis chinensis]
MEKKRDEGSGGEKEKVVSRKEMKEVEERKKRSSPLSKTTQNTTHLASITATFTHSFAYSSAEEAAIERRRRKRRLRIEAPLHALRRDPSAPRLPDSTSALTGPRLSLHNRVQSLIRAGDLETASAHARQAVFSNTHPTVFTFPNIVSYNVLINTHCDAGRVDVALDVYAHILANAPFGPSAVTYRHLTKGLVEADRISDAMDHLREMLNKGHGADSLVYNNLIAGFLELGNVERANELFDELRERCLVYDGTVNATYMNWFFKKGMEKEAMDNYQALLDRQFQMTPATCNVLLQTLLRNGKNEEAATLFQTMLDNHKTPNTQAVNSETFNIMVNEYFRLGKVSEALTVFRQVGKEKASKAFQMDGAGYNNLLGRLCEHGMLEEAEKLFQEMVGKSVILDYNTFRFLIEAYFKEERIDDVLQKFQMLVESNIKGNPRFFSMVFGGLFTKDGKLDLARDLLGDMVRYRVGVTPTLRNSVDEAFGKEGRNDEIERVLGRPFEARQANFAQGPSSGVQQAPFESRQGTFAQACSKHHKSLGRRRRGVIHVIAQSGIRQDNAKLMKLWSCKFC